jgi:tetratricopeptide (TPR) repeat protein
MKKVVLASLLSAAALIPFAAKPAFSQAAAPGGAGVQMSQEEYAKYQAAVNATTPAAKAQAFEDYLKAYPNSAVKTDVLNQLLYAYSQTGDEAKTLDAADRLLAVDPNNIRALTLEVYYRRSDADKLTDPAAKQAALDKAATYAQTGLNATKPKDMSDADWKKVQASADPVFSSAMADDDIAKKDNADAIKVIKAEIAADPADTEKPSPVLQDVYILAQAYYTSTPPDYLDCAWYATRAAAFAPAGPKAQIEQLATYCYTKYHGSKDGYDAMQAAAQSSVDPNFCPASFAKGTTVGTTAAGATPAAGAAPAAGATPAAGSTAAAGTAPAGTTPAAGSAGCLTVKPAPKPEDIVSNLIATTPDLATLALSDKEFVLTYGQPADADKVFDTIKGKAVEIPGAVVVAATADQLQVAVSDDAKQSKTADFTFNMKAPLKTLPNVGDTITLDGTYASYTQKPLMITMSDGSVVLPKKAAPVHHTTTHHTTRR